MTNNDLEGMKELYEEVWGNCLKVIREVIRLIKVSRPGFAPIKPIKLENNVLQIQVPSQFFYEWLEEHYITLLKKTIRNELGPSGRLEYSIVMDGAYSNDPFTIKVPTSNRKATTNPSVAMPIDLNSGSSKEIPNPFVIPGLKKDPVHSQLNEAYSFDNFVEGDCNRLARSAGYAVACNPGKNSIQSIIHL